MGNLICNLQEYYWDEFQPIPMGSRKLEPDKNLEPPLKKRKLFPELDVSRDRIAKVMWRWQISESDALDLIMTVDLSQNGQEWNQVGPSVM